MCACMRPARTSREEVAPALLSTRESRHRLKLAFQGKALTAYPTAFQLWLCRIRQLLSSPRLSPLKAVS